MTGAASGIGQAVAVSFAREGCQRIVILDRNLAGLKATSDSIASANPEVEVVAKQIDISNADAVQEVFKEISGVFGRIDYCVNAAGVIGNNQRSTETDVEVFDGIYGINYRGSFLLALSCTSFYSCHLACDLDAD